MTGKFENKGLTQVANTVNVTVNGVGGGVGEVVNSGNLSLDQTGSLRGSFTLTNSGTNAVLSKDGAGTSVIEGHVFNNGGRVRVTANLGNLNLTGLSSIPQNNSFYGLGGTVSLVKGSGLFTSYGYIQEGGIFRASADLAGGGVQKATLTASEGPVKFIGTSLSIGSGGEGGFLLDSGSSSVVLYNAGLNMNFNYQTMATDRWQAGSFDLTMGGNTVTANELNKPAQIPAFAVVFLDSMNGIDGTFANATTGDLTLEKSADGKTYRFKHN